VSMSGEHSETRRLGYVPALNGLRGVAVGLVVLFHTFTTLIPGNARSSQWTNPFPGAALGVDIFFALSGFLITALLLNEHRDAGRINFRNFYVRRALRLFPALVALLVVTTVYSVVSNEAVSTQLGSILPVAFYVGNWTLTFNRPLSPFLGATWTLAVEEQFYIVWPLIVALSFRMKQRMSLVWLIGGLVLLSLFIRFLTWNDSHRIQLYENTIWRADPLIVGALGAYLWTRGSFPRRLGVWAWIAVAYIAYCVCFQAEGNTFYFFGGFATIGLATTVIIIASVEDVWLGAKILSWAPLRTIGVVSYGIYLWHGPVFVAVGEHLPNAPVIVRVVVGYIITIGFVLLSWFAVERPFLALKPGRNANMGNPDLPAATPWPARIVQGLSGRRN
jgi:peptidoglycan/LPS O-acetylase OafA/YrhL